MALNQMIKCLWRDLFPEYCDGSESSAGYTATPFYVEFLYGGSNRSLPRLPLHMHTAELIPTVLTFNILIG